MNKAAHNGPNGAKRGTIPLAFVWACLYIVNIETQTQWSLIMAREFQGHKNRNHWNVALWLNNDCDNYHLMLHTMKLYGRKNAPSLIKIALANRGMTKTPDGAPYSVSAIRAAMRGLDV